MQAITKQFQQTFASLAIRNYRLYFIGQAISLSGNWMQIIGQGWLVLRLTHSGTILGLVTAAQFLPILVFGLFGGVIVDRFEKRKILFVTQTAMGILALILGTLVVTGVIQLWMVFVLAICLGFVNAVDNPTRQTFILEMVGAEQLSNAVTLNSTEINLARVIGPAIAGILIVQFGLGFCFLVNGISFGAVLLMLAAMDRDALQLSPLSQKVKGQLADGLRYVLSTPLLRDTLIMMAIIGTFTYEFQVILPLVAQFTFHGDAGSYAFLTGAMGLGSVGGGLFAASLKKSGAHMLVITALLFGTSVLLSALSPTFHLAILALVVVGIFSIAFNTIGNVTLQLEAAPEMRGRVMSLWTIAFLGSTPIGGPIIGFIGQNAGPRWGLAVGGSAALLAAAFGYWTLRRQRDSAVSEQVLITSEEAENEESIRNR